MHTRVPHAFSFVGLPAAVHQGVERDALIAENQPETCLLLHHKPAYQQMFCLANSSKDCVHVTNYHVSTGALDTFGNAA